jgi:hypothetical protein
VAAGLLDPFLWSSAAPSNSSLQSSTQPACCDFTWRIRFRKVSVQIVLRLAARYCQQLAVRLGEVLR